MRSLDHRENTATDLQSCCQFQVQVAVHPVVARYKSSRLTLTNDCDTSAVSFVVTRFSTFPTVDTVISPK